MQPQEFINTHQLSPIQFNNLHRILNISFFKNSLNNDYETNNFIELIQQIKSNNYSSTHNTITEFNNKKEIQELVEKKSQEINKNLSQELKQLKDKFNILQDSEQFKSREINSLQLDNQSNENNYNKQIKNLSEQHQNEIRKYEEQKQILKDKNDNLQQEKYKYADNEKQKLTLFHEKETNQLNNTISYERNKIEEINKLFFTKLQEKDNIIQDKDNIIQDKDNLLHEKDNQKYELLKKMSYYKSSQAKGKIGEQFVEDNYMPNNWQIENKSSKPNESDHLLINPYSKIRIRADTKFYTDNVDYKQVEKLIKDLEHTNSDAGIIISLNSFISYKKQTYKQIDIIFILDKPILFIPKSTEYNNDAIINLIIMFDNICKNIKNTNNTSDNLFKIKNKMVNARTQINNTLKDINELKKNNDNMRNNVNKYIKQSDNIIVNLYDNLIKIADYLVTNDSQEQNFINEEQTILQANQEEDNLDETSEIQNNDGQNDQEQNNQEQYQELFNNPPNYNSIDDFNLNMHVIYKHNNKILESKVSIIKQVNIILDNGKVLNINKKKVRILPN